MQDLKKFTSFLTDLRVIETKRVLPFPKIAIVGSPNSGKSCLIECILGIPLLEGLHELKVKYLEINTKTTEGSSVVTYTIDNIGESFNDLGNFLCKLRDYATYMNRNFEETLRISVSAEFLPKMTIIEAPSLSYIDPNITDERFLHEESVKKKIAKKLMKDENIIIVCVLSSLENFNQSRVLDYAREYDPTGERTVGLMTKYDIIEELEQKNEANDIINGKKIPLKFGYHSMQAIYTRDKVKSLSSSSGSVDFNSTKTISMEADIFIRKLKKVICHNLRTRFPSLFNEFQRKAKELEEEMEEIGEELDGSDQDTFNILWKRSNQFCLNLKDAIHGSYMGSTKKKKMTLSCGAYIRSLFYYLYRKEDYKNVFETMEFTEEEIKNVIKGRNAVTLEGFITSDAFKLLTCDRLQYLEEPTMELMKKVHETMSESCNFLLEKHFSRLPELKVALESFINQYLVKQKEFTLQILKPLLKAELQYIFCNDPEKVFQNIYALSDSSSDGNQQTENIFDKMVRELRLSCRLYCENVLMSLRDLVPKIIGQYFLGEIHNNIQIFMTDFIKKTVQETPEILKLTAGRMEERKGIEEKLKIVLKLKSYMIQDQTLYHLLRDPNLEENIVNKYLKMKEVLEQKMENNQTRRRAAHKPSVVKKKKPNFLRRFADWLSKKSANKKKHETNINPRAIQPKMLNPKELAPEEFEIKRVRASSLDMNKTEEKGTQQLVSDFVLIDEYYSREMGASGYMLNQKEWLMAINQGSFDSINRERLVMSLQHGVPKEMRASIWITIANVKKLKASHPKLLYERLSKLPTNWDTLIEKDVPRTFTKEPFFKKPEYEAKEKLHRILRAYANFDPQLGYTQGMNSVAAVFLMVMANYDPGEHKDVSQISRSCEKNAFWLLVYIMENKDFKSMFIDDCPRLIENLFKLERIIQAELPDVFEHMEKESVAVHGCFAQYFLTVFTASAPLEFSKRIMDVFLVNGEPVIFDVLIRTIANCQEMALKLKCEKLFQFFKNEMMDVCFEKFKRELNLLVAATDAGKNGENEA